MTKSRFTQLSLPDVSFLYSTPLSCTAVSSRRETAALTLPAAADGSPASLLLPPPPKAARRFFNMMEETNVPRKERNMRRYKWCRTAARGAR